MTVGRTAAVARPCTPRNATRTPSEGAVAAPIAPTVSPTIAQQKTRRRPRRSPSQPVSGIVTENTSRNDTTTRTPCEAIDPVALGDVPQRDVDDVVVQGAEERAAQHRDERGPAVAAVPGHAGAGGFGTASGTAAGPRASMCSSACSIRVARSSEVAWTTTTRRPYLRTPPLSGGRNPPARVILVRPRRAGGTMHN